MWGVDTCDAKSENHNEVDNYYIRRILESLKYVPFRKLEELKVKMTWQQSYEHYLDQGDFEAFDTFIDKLIQYSASDQKVCQNM